MDSISQTKDDEVGKIDRVYIGGLDPPRLTANHVLDRLKNVKIHSIESHEDKPYCHVAASVLPVPDTSKDATPKVSASKSAFEVIFSTFNNVKWKGCKLSVQIAQPTFLDRLRLEIEEREKEKKEQANKIMGIGSQLESASVSCRDAPTSEENLKQEQPKIPRRLRIKKKFGEEAYHVDTKPWSVDNWENYRSARTKLDKRAERHVEKRKEKEHNETVAPLMHRAIYIRFDDNLISSKTSGPASMTPGIAENMNDNVPPLLQEVLSGNDSQSDSESDSSVSSRNMDEALQDGRSAKNTKDYKWSDEESDEEDMGSSGSISHNHVIGVFQKEDGSTGLSHTGSVSSDIKSKDSNQVSSKQIDASQDEQKYQWSSDEESSEDDDFFQDRSAPLRPVVQSDEFASGIDIGESEEKDPDFEESEKVLDEGSDVGENILPDSNDLGNDVSANLNILSSLFPEVEAAQPALLAKQEEELSEQNGNKRKEQSTSGFGASGIMLRYDPNKESNQQFEIEDVNDEIDKMEQTEDETMSNEAEAKSKSDEPELEQIYEEKKLEGVFKDAREGWKERNTRNDGNNGGNGVSSFSFGFDLGIPAPAESTPDQNTATKGGFSFGFDVPLDGTPAVNGTTKDKSSEMAGVDNTVLDASLVLPERRINGFVFPNSVVKEYEKAFFSANNGTEIMKDLDAFRNDENDKKEWNKERQILTLDWKRKRKHAQSRIQKRMKIR